MKRRTFLAGAAAGSAALAAPAIVRAQQAATLRVHQMLPAQATIPSKAIEPWARRVEEMSDGRLKFEIYPSMQLGGAPPSLYDQAKDGVVDVVQTVLGYTPGRFPKTEVFELPFLMTNGEDSSVAMQEYVEANSMDEFADIKLLCVHTHGPGLFHTVDPVNQLEDLQGMKIRGGSRIVNDMLVRLGAEPIGMPVPQVTEALSSGVISGTTIPWEVTLPLRVSELVSNHTGFAGTHGLYTQTFGFTMNLERYNSLPDDLKAIIDENSGVELARKFGIAMDEGDAVGLKVAQDRGNNIITLDEAETARWREAAQPTIDQWYGEMQAAGVDGKALHEAAMALVEKHSMK